MLIKIKKYSLRSILGILSFCSLGILHAQAVDFEVDQEFKFTEVLSEPQIAQPLQISFDFKGQMWVVEYRQYPKPAGSLVISKDQFDRVLYDQVPKPPPNGTEGADRISIHSNPDSNGRYQKHSIFLDRLNLVSSIATFPGGVWVLNPPYLLLYEDKDQDNLPDGNPELHIEGFGIEDTHALANSLTWGPDGWLYGAQGSTVSSFVKTPKGASGGTSAIGQVIWRYHPNRKKFEIFAEGGGNNFCIEFDDKGRLFSGHNGADTRGFYFLQGAYYQKGFLKHGPLSNPYAYGYFPPLMGSPSDRFSHALTIYGGGVFPDKYGGSMFSLNPLKNEIIVSRLYSRGTTFGTIDTKLIVKGPKNFRPVDIKHGPDGNLYIADWKDPLLAHVQAFDYGSETNSGSVFKLVTKKTRQKQASSSLFNSKLNEVENKWVQQNSLQLISKGTVVSTYFEKCLELMGQTSLQNLWSANQAGTLDDSDWIRLLHHREPYVRLWAVRLVCDFPADHQHQCLAEISKIAISETNRLVEAQIISSSSRLPAPYWEPVFRQLLLKDRIDDSQIPLLLWWNLELMTRDDSSRLLRVMTDLSLWDTKIFKEVLLDKIIARWIEQAKPDSFQALLKLVDLAPKEIYRKQILSIILNSVTSLTLTQIPRELQRHLAENTSNFDAMRLGVLQRNPGAISNAVARILDPKADPKQREDWIPLLASTQDSGVQEALKALALSPSNTDLQTVALQGLGQFTDPDIAQVLISCIKAKKVVQPDIAFGLLTSRKNWAKLLLDAVSSGEILKTEVPMSAIKNLQLYGDPNIARTARMLWQEKPLIPLDMQNEMQELVKAFKTLPSDPFRGREIFLSKCSSCHRKFNEGSTWGPDLSILNQQNLEGAAISILLPSAEIREGFNTTEIITKDGSSLFGFLVQKNEGTIVLRTLYNTSVKISEKEIESIQNLPGSVMPEGLMNDLSVQQKTDLLAFILRGQPLVDPKVLRPQVTP